MNSLLAVIKKCIELWDFIAIKNKCCRWSSYSYRLATAFQFSVIFSCLTNILLCFIRSLSIPVHQNHLCYAVEIHFCIFVFIQDFMFYENNGCIQLLTGGIWQQSNESIKKFDVCIDWDCIKEKTHFSLLKVIMPHVKYS